MHKAGAWRAWAQRLLKEWAVTVAIGLVALFACAKLGEDVFSHETGTFDGAIQSWVMAHQQGALIRAFLAITYMGSVPVMVSLAVVGAWWLWRRSGRETGAAALIAPTIATTLFLVLKQFFARARPTIAGHPVLKTYAFPSGHATASTAVCCTLAFVYWREGFISRRGALCIAIIPPLLIGLSRVYLDVHWATDVLGGWSLGLLVAVMGAILFDRHRRPEADVKPGTPAAVPQPHP